MLLWLKKLDKKKKESGLNSPFYRSFVNIKTINIVVDIILTLYTIF
jgi:hypothetical protein